MTLPTRIVDHQRFMIINHMTMDHNTFETEMGKFLAIYISNNPKAKEITIAIDKLPNGVTIYTAQNKGYKWES